MGGGMVRNFLELTQRELLLINHTNHICSHHIILDRIYCKVLAALLVKKACLLRSIAKSLTLLNCAIVWTSMYVTFEGIPNETSRVTCPIFARKMSFSKHH